MEPFGDPLLLREQFRLLVGECQRASGQTVPLNATTGLRPTATGVLLDVLTQWCVEKDAGRGQLGARPIRVQNRLNSK